ncbi:MAG: sugar transferase, partial [Chitinispirillia bacterium]
MHTQVYKRKILLDLFKLVDVVLICFTFLAAIALSMWPIKVEQFIDIVNMRISLNNVLFIAVYSVFCHLIFQYHGFYESHRLSEIEDEIINIMKTSTICTAILLGGVVLFQISVADLRFLAFFWLAQFLFFAFSRILLRSLLSVLRMQGRNLRRALIVGKNPRSEKYAESLRNNRKLGYQFKGFVDVKSNPGKAEEQKNLVCDFNGFQDYIRSNVVDEIFLFLPIKSFYRELNDIIAKCEEQGIIVRMFINLFRLRFAKTRVEWLGHDSLITFFTGNMNRNSIIVKETIDFILAFILIIMCSPVMLVAALLIKILSPGPVFFLQDRIGIHKRKFKIIKFRTMYIDAEKRLEEFAYLNETGSDGAFKIKNDPRVTPIGKILRAFSIDELPQFFNVLKGDMSII